MSKKTNLLDTQIKAFVDKLASIEGFEDASSDKNGKMLLELIIGTATDLHLYKNMFCNEVIPAIDRAINKATSEIKQTSYPQIIPNSIEKLRQSKIDFIRHAYVSIFHKYEIFAKRLLEILNEIADNSEIEFLKNGVEKYALKKFNFSFVENWHKIKPVHTVQYVSNAAKHKGGSAFTRFDKPDSFKHLSDNMSIEVTVQNFKDDFDTLTSQLPSIVQVATKINSCYIQEDLLYAWIELGIAPVEKEDAKLKLLKLERDILILLRDLFYTKHLKIPIERSWQDFEILKNNLDSSQITINEFNKGKEEILSRLS